MTGKVVPIGGKGGRGDPLRLTCDCVGGGDSYGFALYNVLLWRDRTVSYQCANCGAETEVTPADLDAVESGADSF